MPTDTPQHSADLAVEATGLMKRFGSTTALDGLDLAIPRACIYGVLGPNGAGKTTVIRILATLLRPDAGTARVFGHDLLSEPAAARARMSLTSQFASVDGQLTATENLVLLARLLGHSRRHARRRSAELLDAFDLSAVAGRLVSQLSGGMRRRLDIAASIIVTPDLLFLDEPTTGLDPRSRNALWDVVRTIVAQGTTVLLTTQYLDEADRLADRIAVIDHGRAIAEGTRAELKSSVGSSAVRVRLVEPAQREDAARILSGRLQVPVRREADPATVSARLPATGVAEESGARAAGALDVLSRAGIAVADFSLGQPSLDEVFLALTGSPAVSSPAAPAAREEAIA